MKAGMRPATVSEELGTIATNLHGVACALIKYQSGDHPGDPNLEPAMLYMLSDLLAADGDRLSELSDRIRMRERAA